MKNSKSYSLIMLLIMAISGVSFAQSSYEDKIGGEQSFSGQEICTMKLDSAMLIFDAEPEKALSLVEDALLLAIKNGYQNEEGKAYWILGDFNFSLSEFNISLKNYEKAINILSEPKPSQKISKGRSKKSESFSRNMGVSTNLYLVYKQAGKAAELSGNLEESLGYYFSFMKKAEDLNNQDDIIYAKIGIANVYLDRGDYENAKKYYSEVLTIEEARGNKRGIVEANKKLGKLSQEQNSNAEALGYFEKSRDLALEIEDDEAVNEAFGNISEIMVEEDNIPQQLETSQQAMQFNASRGNVKDLAKNSLDLGNIYIETDSTEKAIKHLKKGIELSDEAGDIETKSRAVRALSEAYEKEGSEEDALEKYKEYIELEDSINKIFKKTVLAFSEKGRLLENTQNKMLVLEKDKQLDEKTIELLMREKKLQEEQIKRQRLISWFLGGGIFLLLITSLLVYRSNTEKRKANRLLMLKSLRSQMNPHFIFNALNSVNNYISSSNERAANKYLADFSKLMRDVLENSSHDFIPLSKEIDILSLYLKLEHSRFQDKFDYKFEVENSIDKEAFLIPPMLIQPYIENAVWHGLRYKKEKGYLNVFIKQKNETIEITVEDNGIGRKKSQEIKTENQKVLESTGLKNISSRLKIIREVYKVRLDVTIKDLDITTSEGTVVTLLIHKSNP